MNTEEHGDINYTKDFEDVQVAEREWIKQAREVNQTPVDAPIIGLAFSGGGIRSASFNLGVLQALAKHDWLSRIDYLSTVSGGGYIGSFYSWLKSQLGKDFPKDFASIPLSGHKRSVMDWLRSHGNYLINGQGFSVWTLVAAILSGTLLNLIVLLPLFLCSFALLSANWFSLGWPVWLHLPGASPVTYHDGFMVVLITSLISFLCYFLSLLIFALSRILPTNKRGSQHSYTRQLMGMFLAVGFIGGAVGLLPVLANTEESVLHYTASETWASLSRPLSYLIPLIAGLVSITGNYKSSSDFTKRNQRFVIIGLSLLIYSFFMMMYHIVAHTHLLETVFFMAWCGVSVFLALFCDVNAISMHSYYRGRLAQAYLPPLTKGQSGENFSLTRLTPNTGNPLHIINTTLNTRSSHKEKLHSRSGESLFLSPIYCGSSSTGYQKTNHYLKGQLTLSNAMAISGAAVDPDTIATRSQPISFLMALFNIRLGIWVDNPNKKTSSVILPSWYQLLLREMLGVGLSPEKKQIHLSDGGHFENLGLYELLRRRCQYIITCDAGADPQTALLSLGQAIQKARADFGAEVDMDVQVLMQATGGSIHESAHIIGTIRYADGSHGKILYLKALVTKDLSADIMSYRKTNPMFPNQATSDQFFDEMQFDSYRELGLQLMSNFICQDSTDDISDVFSS